jgi:hypothetical protein
MPAAAPPPVLLQVLPARPYKVGASSATPLPQPSRTLLQKMTQFVLGA